VEAITVGGVDTPVEFSGPTVPTRTGGQMALGCDSSSNLPPTVGQDDVIRRVKPKMSTGQVDDIPV